LWKNISHFLLVRKRERETGERERGRKRDNGRERERERVKKEETVKDGGSEFDLFKMKFKSKQFVIHI